MEALFLKLVNMSITASWLVLAIALVRLMFRKTPKWILCLLWGLVALRLLCPFTLESALSLVPSPEPLPQEIIYTASPRIQSGVGIIDAAVNPVLESSLTPATHVTSANPTQIWSFILSWVWAIGVAVMGLYTLISYLLLKRRVAAAIPVEKGIKQCEFIDSPFVLGVICPVIYLPFDMAEGDMAYVIAHEKAHIRRRDHWWKPLGFALLSVYWFNPVLWLAYILLCRDIEAACDEKVIRDMEKDDRRAYSSALLHCSVHRRSIAACPLAFGEVGVKDRIRGVMNYRKPAFWVIVIALILCVVIAVGFLTNPSGMKLTEIDDSRNYADLLTNTEYLTLIIEGEEYPVRDEAGLLAALEEVTVRDFTLLRSRSETRDKTHQIHLRGNTYLNFSWDYSRVWIDNGMKPTYTYRVINTGKVREIFDSIRGVNLRIDAADVTSTGLKLVHKPEGVFVDIMALVEDNHWLEYWDGTQWKTYKAMSGNDRDPINVLITADRDIHELDWKTNYGTLPVGQYRICQDYYFFDASQLYTIYTEFAVEEQVPIIQAEDADSKGLTLVYSPVEAFPDMSLLRYDDYWLEYWDGSMWQTQKALRKIKDYIEITAASQPDRHILDWSQSYGALQPGTYRLVMEYYSREKDQTEYFYAEFAVDETRPVTAWFDIYEGTAAMQMRRDEPVYWPGLDGVKLQYESSYDGERIICKTDSSEETIVTGWPVRNAYFSDLSGDGIPELCTTVSEGFGMIDNRIRVYNYVEKQLYELEDRGESDYALSLCNEALAVTRTDAASGAVLEMGVLAIDPDKGELRLLALDDSFQVLIQTVSCVDIHGRRITCIQNPEQMTAILSLLRDLNNGVVPAEQEELEAAKDYHLAYNGYSIIVNYGLGEKQLCFSKDFDLIWEAGADTGYRISDPEPIRSFVSSAVDGVKGRETEGTAFATMDVPWDWTAGISAGAVQEAQITVCLEKASNGLSNQTGSTGGLMTTGNLEELTTVLNQLPRAAFSEGKILEKETFFWYFGLLNSPGCAVYLIDTVNDLAAVLHYEENQVQLLLTDETDKVDRVLGTYLQPTQLWIIDDPALTAYMAKLQQYSPTVTYTVGAEYDWQETISFEADGFHMDLSLIEGWAYETVQFSDHSGIRARPAGVEEGWIWFSFWPEGYHPREEDRYLDTYETDEYVRIVSWPADVQQPGSFSTYGRIWSYQLHRYETGDFAIINDGADSWFPDYEDQIDDTVTMAMFSYTIGD